MTKERRYVLEREDACLTDAEFKEGYHFCDDWDGLLVGSEDRELECCTCHWKDPKMDEKMQKAKQNMRSAQ